MQLHWLLAETLPPSSTNCWTQMPNVTNETFLDPALIDTPTHFCLTPQYSSVESMTFISPSLHWSSLFPPLPCPLSCRLLERNHALSSLSFVFSLQHGNSHFFLRVIYVKYKNAFVNCKAKVTITSFSHPSTPPPKA